VILLKVIMRIELYKISKNPDTFDVGAQLMEIARADMNRRNRSRSNDFVRLEAMESRDKLVLCDFVKIRMHHGPSKAGLSAPARGFDLAHDEGFGEETAFLWDSTNDWCVIQYNHHGVRPKSIAEYLSLYKHDAPVTLEFQPKIDDAIHAKIRSKRVVTKFTITVAPKDLTNNDFNLGAGLGQAVRDLRHSDADRVEITISAKRNRRLDLSLVGVADWIRRLAGTSSDHSPVYAARATARQEDGDEPEVLDLLHHRIIAETPLTPGPDKRYPRRQRWDAIHRAHTQWKKLMT